MLFRCLRRFSRPIIFGTKPTPLIRCLSNSKPLGKEPEYVKIHDTDSNIPDRKLLLGVTCKVCSTRSHRMVSHNSFHKGIILFQCPSCQTRHLISDNIGWFKDLTKEIGGKDVEEIGRLKGEHIAKALKDVKNLEDIQYLEKEGFTRQELAKMIDDEAKGEDDEEDECGKDKPE